MSKKTDLLVRVRYSNPLPLPPFPPRLLHIETNPQRYTSYDFLQPLNSERELSLVLDAELGLPAEYGKVAEGEHSMGDYWTGSRSQIAPDSNHNPALHEDDAFLVSLEPNQSTATNGGAATPASGSSTPAGVKRTDVSWLRRTEYLSSEPGSKLAAAPAPGSQSPNKPAIELTRQTRCDAIKASFTSSASPLSNLGHPMKSHLQAEESWDIFPDVSLWPNTLNLVRFGEDPGQGGETSSTTLSSDVKLPRALFRPLELPNEPSRIAYYLPKDAATAIAAGVKRRAGPLEVAPEDEAFEYGYVRDYEPATVRLLNEEFIFCFDDGPGSETNGTEGIKEEEGGEVRSKKRPRGLYYSGLRSAQTLRKRRPKRGEDPTVFSQEAIDAGNEFWDGISMKVGTLDVLDEEEREERQRVEDQVNAVPSRL
ncbi:hypothetical protein T439DRAFT_320650 [Meredithblackwellia eburnea MCA 4105]